jgi:hypothetical protein
VKRCLLALCLLTVAFVGCAGGGDEDSLSADAEARGWSVTATYPNGTERSYSVTSDPAQTDTDGDGLDDFQELDAGTDPRAIDTDHDRLLDGSTLCPESGSDLEDRALEGGVLEHPGEPGCFLGEERTEIGDFTYSANPTNAHSDSSPQLSDRLADGTEVEGWQVQPVDGDPYHVRSKPGLRNADTDQDGLHDGLEKTLATDPTLEDTDDDGVSDLSDAAPLGNLKVTAHVRAINLKEDFKLGGGADLVVEASSGQTSDKRSGSISRGNNQLGWALALDVSDRGSNLTEELGGAYADGNWAKEVRLSFTHDAEEPIEVRNDGSETHLLVLTYDAFADDWDGHAQGGSSSGPDADVTIDVTSSIE